MCVYQLTNQPVFSFSILNTAAANGFYLLFLKKAEYIAVREYLHIFLYIKPTRRFYAFIPKKRGMMQDANKHV